MTDDERRRAMDAIAAEVRVCTRCPLHRARTNAVPGEGSAATEVVFVGEGPGFNEDQQGRPFVGAAGGLLTELLGHIGWRRDEVFITNLVKCRPPGNRDPEPDEIAACAPYLQRQLETLDPALVVTLGRFSLGTFMPGARIGSAHGTVRHVDPASGARDADAFALYHPAAAFRQQQLRETLFDEMASVPDALIRSRERRGARPAGEANARESAMPTPESSTLSAASAPEPTGAQEPSPPPASAALPPESAILAPAPAPAVESAAIATLDLVAEAATTTEPEPNTDQLRLF